MRLILIRHGETYANLSMRWSGSKDLKVTDLTENGKDQAKKLGQWFQDQKFIPTHAYHSPQRRARNTAQLAGGHWNLKMTATDYLKETGAGIFEGLTWKEIEDKYPKEADLFRDSRDWSYIPEAESEEDRRSRAKKVLSLILQNHSNEDVVVMFCHAGIIQHIVSVIFESPKLLRINIHNTALFEFSIDINNWNTSTREKFNPTLWRIIHFNSNSHLN